MVGVEGGGRGRAPAQMRGMMRGRGLEGRDGAWRLSATMGSGIHFEFNYGLVG